jgi:hypothetical protein
MYNTSTVSICPHRKSSTVLPHRQYGNHHESGEETLRQITETKLAVAHLTAPHALHFSSISSFLFRTLITVSGLPQE